MEEVLSLIGRTPLVRLSRIVPENCAEILAKLEMRNPGGSVKDRTALGMIRDAEEKGILSPRSTIIEPSSGNTGIALAMISAIKGYRCIIVMPESMSIERRKIIASFGAEIVLTPAEGGMTASVERAKSLLKEIPHSWMPDQFSNPANPKIHEETTGPEILRDCDGIIDCFIAGIGTGGTITGVGRYLKRKLPKIFIVGIEPSESPFISEGRSGRHGIQGIGAGFKPRILDMGVIDEIITIDTETAKNLAREISRKEGISAGISSGAALAGAIRIAKMLGTQKRIVTIFPDSGERYLSTDLF